MQVLWDVTQNKSFVWKSIYLGVSIQQERLLSSMKSHMLRPGALVFLKGQKGWWHLHNKRGEHLRDSAEPEDGEAFGVEECL